MAKVVRALMGAALIAGSVIAVGPRGVSARRSPPAFHAVEGASENAVACASSTYCVAVGPTTLLSTDGGVTWNQAARPIVNAVVNDVNCPSTTLCIAVGG